ncbi:hypothetical protein B0H67DRAFT_234908 [Lasiosphaeris hirsuta]|uniref:Uncharacterized protein n=1 Tax=Lasiosphaeris hirsuta TaxID=260670 RepID=A0AA40AFX6_9PEZI|nr:hypothetical protein B0H67DRAFT_234908 [Lasiosphaeris hirsuta]
METCMARMELFPALSVALVAWHGAKKTIVAAPVERRRKAKNFSSGDSFRTEANYAELSLSTRNPHTGRGTYVHFPDYMAVKGQVCLRPAGPPALSRADGDEALMNAASDHLRMTLSFCDAATGSAHAGPQVPLAQTDRTTQRACCRWLPSMVHGSLGPVASLLPGDCAEASSLSPASRREPLPAQRGKGQADGNLWLGSTGRKIHLGTTANGCCLSACWSKCRSHTWVLGPGLVVPPSLSAHSFHTR